MRMKNVLGAVLVLIASASASFACSGDASNSPAGFDSGAPPGPDAEAPFPDATTGAGMDAAPDALSMRDARADGMAAVPEAGVPEAGIDAGMPEVRYVGRFDRSSALGPRVGFPAARAIVRFEGTELKATLGQVKGYGSGPSYIDTIVDGVALSTALVVPEGTSTLTVATGLAFGEHTVEMVKRTEGYHGVVQFKGFAYPGGGRLLAPPPARTRRIEMLGNSAVNGYGLEGMGPVCAGGTPPSSSNARKTAGVIAADTLNADLVMLGVGGKGITINNTPGDLETFPVLFERTLPESAAPLWNHAANVPDAFVLTTSNLDIDTEDNARVTAFETFVQRIRTVYPTTSIFLVVSSYATDDFPTGKMTRTRLLATVNAVAARRVTAGDTKVYAYGMTQYVAGQLTGCDYHPGPVLHAQMAAELTTWLRARLAW
jgi:hypothetical protein